MRANRVVESAVGVPVITIHNALVGMSSRKSTTCTNATNDHFERNAPPRHEGWERAHYGPHGNSKHQTHVGTEATCPQHQSRIPKCSTV